MTNKLEGGVTVVVLFILQASVIPFLFNGIFAPDLWLVFITLAAFILDRNSTIMMALVGGLLQDIVIGNLFGLHVLPYLCISILFIKYVREKYNKHWYLSSFAVIVSSLLYIVLSRIILIWAGVPLESLKSILYLGVPFALWNGLVAVIFHHILWAMRIEGEPRW